MSDVLRDEESSTVSTDDTSLYRPGYELAAERIVEYITEREFAPGDRLPTEAELARMLGFGRSVIREAVKVLSALGRIQPRKGAGLFVSDDSSLIGPDVTSRFLPGDLNHLEMLFEFRATVDGEAARLAASRATPLQLRAMRTAVQQCRQAVETNDRVLFDTADTAFHEAIAAAAHNMFAESVLIAMRRLQEQTIVLGLQGRFSGSANDAVETHEAILRAIENGSPDEAAHAALDHVQRTWAGYREEIHRRILGHT